MEMWELKVKKVSKVTPRILGVLSRGMVEPLIWMEVGLVSTVRSEKGD